MYGHNVPMGGAANMPMSYTANGSMLGMPSAGFQPGNQQVMLPNTNFQVMPQAQQAQQIHHVAPSMRPAAPMQPNVVNHVPSTVPAPLTQRPPMQRDHYAIQRMNHGVVRPAYNPPQKPAYNPAQKPAYNPAQKPVWNSNIQSAATTAKRQLPEATVSAAKKSKTVEADGDFPVEQLRKLLRIKADAMLKEKKGRRPFDESTAYELTKVRADFEAMFKYPLPESKLHRKTKISELVFRHANDIMCLRATRSRGTMLIPAGEQFQETAGSDAAPGDAAPLKSPTTPSKRTVIPPATPVQDKPAATPAPAPVVDAPVDLTEDTDPDSPKTTNAEPAPAAAPAPIDTPEPNLEPNPSGIMPLFRRKLSSACFTVTKDAEYVLKSESRRQALDITLQPTMKTVEQAMKCKEFKQFVTKTQTEKALPLLTTYQEIASAVNMDWEAVKEAIDTEFQGNVVLSNAATISMSKDGLAILFPAVRGLKAYSSVKDLVSLLAEQLLPLTPSAVKPSTEAVKLEKFQQDFQQKFKYKVDTAVMGYPNMKALLESDLLKPWVEVTAGKGADNWLLKPKFDPLRDFRNFLEGHMLQFIDKQKQEQNFRLPHEQGLKTDNIKADFPLEYLYDINCIPIGFPDFPALLSANQDICEVREEKGKPVRVHPSPLLHLKLLLQASVQGTTPIYDDQGARVPTVNPEDGYNITDIMDDFQGIYEYPLKLSQFGLGSINDALDLLKDTCATVVGKDKQTYLFPPKKEAQNGFLLKLRAKAVKKETNPPRTVTSPAAAGGKPTPSRTITSPAAAGSKSNPPRPHVNVSNSTRPIASSAKSPAAGTVKSPVGSSVKSPAAVPSGPTRNDRPANLAPTRVMSATRANEPDRSVSRSQDANRGTAYTRGPEASRYGNRPTGLETGRSSASTWADTNRGGNRITPDRARPQQHDTARSGIGSGDSKVMQAKPPQPSSRQQVQQHPQQFMLASSQHGQNPAYGQMQMSNVASGVNSGVQPGMQMGGVQGSVANNRQASAAGGQATLPPGFGQQTRGNTTLGASRQGVNSQGMNNAGHQAGVAATGMQMGGDQAFRLQGPAGAANAAAGQAAGGAMGGGFMGGGMPTLGLGLGNAFMSGMGNTPQQQGNIPGQGAPTMLMMSNQAQNTAMPQGGSQQGQAQQVAQQHANAMQAGQTYVAIAPQMQSPMGSASKNQATAANASNQGQGVSGSGMMGLGGMMNNFGQASAWNAPQSSMPQSNMTNVMMTNAGQQQQAQRPAAPPNQAFQQMYATQHPPAAQQQQQQQHYGNQPAQQQQQMGARGSGGPLAMGSMGMGLGMMASPAANSNAPSMSGYPSAGTAMVMAGQQGMQGMQQPGNQGAGGFQQGQPMQMGQAYAQYTQYGQNANDAVPRMSGYGQ